MQMGNCRCKAQAEARTRFRAALFQPHEALDHTLAVAFGDAWTVIGHAEPNMAPVAFGFH